MPDECEDGHANFDPTSTLSDAHVVGGLSSSALASLSVDSPGAPEPGLQQVSADYIAERWKAEFEFSYEALLHRSVAAATPLGGPSGRNASLVVLLGDMEALHKRQQDEGGDVEHHVHCTLMHWENVADLYGRPCRIDTKNEIVWSVPLAIKNRKVDVNEIVYPDCGVHMDKTVRLPRFVLY